jgi:hypothetical protein
LSVISEKTGNSKIEISIILKKITAQVVFCTAEEDPVKYIREAI